MGMLFIFLAYISISIVESTVDYLQHPVKSCHIGDSVVNQCNKCLCTSKSVFECKPINCNKTKVLEESEATRELCVPNQLYVQNLITCICTKDGRWPHKSCFDTFQSLPPTNVVKFKCEQDTYVPIDCNICRCGSNGEVNTERCTRNSCDDESKRRANFGSNSVYSNCEVKNWYSLAPCQFCFCVNQNKLVCNTGNYYSKKLELGSYNLRVCGKELIREAIELIPDNQKMLRFGFGASNVTTTKQRAEITSVTPVPIFASVREEHNVAVEVNRESNENKTRFEKAPKLEEISSSKEYYTDSEEETQNQANEQNTQQQQQQQPKQQQQQSQQHNEQQQQLLQKILPNPTLPATTRQASTTAEPQETKGLSTKFPIEEGDEMLSESDINAEEDVEEDSNEIVVELDQPMATKPPVDVALHTFSEIPTIKPQTINAPTGKSAESYQYVGNTLKINLPKVLNKVFQLALRKSMVSLTNESKCTPGSTSLKDCNMCFCLKNSKLLCTNNKCPGGQRG